MSKFYIKCQTCGVGSPRTWYFDVHSEGTAKSAAQMHSMLKHTTEVRLIATDKAVATFRDGLEVLNG